MQSGNEDRIAVGTVAPTTLAILDRCATIAFEALGDCSANYSRPSVQMGQKTIPRHRGYILRIGRSNSLQTIGLGESPDLLVDVWRLGKAANHEDVLVQSAKQSSNKP